ncbi:hypothetical protein POTOM_040712 [Populus tomentosa]|uniref:Prohibitin n=1 Tax=Populus tomentosa TaxID=118781 RepID=A0A8X8CHK5_POPTO|nr:hypothetical protein POTOM_040712 [Populus tomentosa]
MRLMHVEYIVFCIAQETLEIPSAFVEISSTVEFIRVGNMAMKNVNIPKAPKVASTLATIGAIGLPTIYNIHAQPHLMDSTAGSRDLQTGEAKTAEVISQAMANNQSFLAPRKIEAAREIALVISNAKNKVY